MNTLLYLKLCVRGDSPSYVCIHTYNYFYSAAGGKPEGVDITVAGMCVCVYTCVILSVTLSVCAYYNYNVCDYLVNYI